MAGPMSPTMGGEHRMTLTVSGDVQQQIHDAARAVGILPTEYLLRCHRIAQTLRKHGGTVEIVRADGTRVAMEIV